MVAVLDGVEQAGDFLPERPLVGLERVAVVDHQPAGELPNQFLRLGFQRPAAVHPVPLEGEKVLVLGIGDKEESKEDRHGHFVSLGQVAGRGLLEAAGDGEPLGQGRHDLAVDALAQALGQLAGPAARPFEQGVEAAALGQRVAGEEQPQVSGVAVAQVAGVDFEVGLGASAAADADAHLDGVEAQLAATDDDDVGQVLAVGDVQGVGDGRQAAEALGFEVGCLAGRSRTATANFDPFGPARRMEVAPSAGSMV